DPGWIERSTQLGWVPLAVRASIPETSQTATVSTAPETVAPKTDAAFVDQEQVAQTAQSLASLPQTATVATTPETVAPKTDAAVLDQEQAAQTPQSPASLPQTVEQLAAGRAQIAPEEAKLQAADVEILAKIPVPRPRPPAALARRSMPALPRSARALITPPSPRIPPR